MQNNVLYPHIRRSVFIPATWSGLEGEGRSGTHWLPCFVGENHSHPLMPAKLEVWSNKPLS